MFYYTKGSEKKQWKIFASGIDQSPVSCQNENKVELIESMRETESRLQSLLEELAASVLRLIHHAHKQRQAVCVCNGKEEGPV